LDRWEHRPFECCGGVERRSRARIFDAYPAVMRLRTCPR